MSQGPALGVRDPHCSSLGRRLGPSPLCPGTWGRGRMLTRLLGQAPGKKPGSYCASHFGSRWWEPRPKGWHTTPCLLVETDPLSHPTTPRGSWSLKCALAPPAPTTASVPGNPLPGKLLSVLLFAPLSQNCLIPFPLSNLS